MDDTDAIIGGIALAVVVLLGIVVIMVLGCRDKIGKTDKRLDAQTQRISRIVEWIEGQGKRRGKGAK